MIWPYAVAPAIAGVLWLFMFQPSLGVVARFLRALGVDWNPLLNGEHAMALVIMIIGGYAILDVKSKAEAVEVARRCWQITADIMGPTYEGSGTLLRMWDASDFA